MRQPVPQVAANRWTSPNSTRSNDVIVYELFRKSSSARTSLATPRSTRLNPAVTASTKAAGGPGCHAQCRRRGGAAFPRIRKKIAGVDQTGYAGGVNENVVDVDVVPVSGAENDQVRAGHGFLKVIGEHTRQPACRHLLIPGFHVWIVNHDPASRGQQQLREGQCSGSS